MKLSRCAAAIVFAPLLFGLVGCATPDSGHKLVGSWKASDGTVFIFRTDGTFIGRDYMNHRIFGNWVELDDSHIGFQTLMHAGGYNPQYAEVTADGMRYAYSDASRFVSAVRMEPALALQQTRSAALNKNDFR